MAVPVRVASPASRAHQTAHRLSDDVVPRTLAVASRVAESRYGAVDDTRIDFFQSLVAQPQFLHRSGTEVLEYHIGLLQHPQKNTLALWILQI